MNKDTGALVWSHLLSEYTGVKGTVSRVSPALYSGLVIVGDQVPNAPPHLIAVSQTTGALVWITQVETHLMAHITASPVVANGRVYAGIASQEEPAARNSTYPCCTFRGSVVALDASSGMKLWQTYTLPDNGGVPGGYSGAGVWATPTVDLTRNSLYVATGDNYTVPASVGACLQADPTSKTCTDPNDFFDSVLALDLTTGAIKWGRKMYPYDAWNASCTTTDKTYCPDPAGPDYDFASGPNLLGNLVGVGQKTGVFYALNPDTGSVVWSTSIGPGAGEGGIVWGTATDGTRIYAGQADSPRKPYRVVPTGQQLTWGSWSALDAQTGKLLWQTADPTLGARDSGSVSVANGVLYAGSLDAAGHMYALNTATGQILWSFASGGSVLDAPSIVNGVLYWGSGYRRGHTGNNKVYAFQPVSAPVVNVKTPTQNMASNSPVRFSAAASTPCSGGIASTQIFTGGTTPVFSTTSATFSTSIALSPGVYNVIVQTADICGGTGDAYVTVNVVNCPPPTGKKGIRFCAPATSTPSSPFQVTGSANLTGRTTMQLFVDGQVNASSNGNVFSQLIRLPSGSHVLNLKAVSSSGKSYSMARTVTVQ